MSEAYLMSQDVVNTCYINWIYICISPIFEEISNVFSVPRIPADVMCSMHIFSMNELHGTMFVNKQASLT